MGLGIASGPSWVQTEQPAQGQATECAAGAQSADCPKPEGSKGSKQDRVAPEGGAATEGSGTTSEGTAQPEKPAADAQKPKASEQGQASEPAGGQQAEQPKQPASGTDAEQPAQSGQGEQPKQGEATQQNVNITIEQKTEITQIIKEEKVEPITVNVDVSVGVVVPQTVKVKLRPLPPRIVKIVPAYADYLFFLLADGRIVIVEPSTLKIVVILV